MAVIINFNPCEVANGVYHHYKGGIYEVLGGMYNAETDTEMVVYRMLSRVNSSNNKLFSRSVANFTGSIDLDGIGIVQRFTRCN